MIIQHQNERFIVALLDFVCLVLAVVFLRIRDKNDIVRRKSIRKEETKTIRAKNEEVVVCVCGCVCMVSFVTTLPEYKTELQFCIFGGFSFVLQN